MIDTIGWGRLRVIAHTLDGGHAGYWLKMATQKPIRELKSMVNGKGIQDFKPVVFHLSAPDREELDGALAQFGARRTFRGLEHGPEALMRLVRSMLTERRALKKAA